MLSIGLSLAALIASIIVLIKVEIGIRECDRMIEELRKLRATIGKD